MRHSSDPCVMAHSRLAAWHVDGRGPGNLKTRRNMKYLMTAAALCLGMWSAQAQTGTPATIQPANHNCLASTTDKDWARLDLNAEQTTKVKAIQGESMKANDKLKADNMDSKESPMLNKYEEELKKVLTPAQYEKWVKECSTRAGKPTENKNAVDKSN